MQIPGVESAVPRRERAKELFVYVSSGTNLIPISASASNIENNITIGSEAHFIMARTMADARSSAVGAFSDQNQIAVTVQWRNSASQRNYQNEATALPNLY